MKLKGVWGASLVMAALAASSCDQEHSAPRPQPTPASAHSTRQQIRSDDYKVLILGSSVVDGLNSREALAVAGWDPSIQIDVVTPEQWSAMTADQFMSYRTIIIGDAACQSGTAAFQAAIDNRATWGAVVDGDVAILAADPTSNNTPQLVENGVHYALNSVQGLTGMYIALGCAYQDAPPDTVVDLLEPFGTFKVQGLSTCANSAHMFEMNNDLMSQNIWFADYLLPGDGGCAARSVFTAYPEHTFSFAALAMYSDPSMVVPGQTQYIDYTINLGNETAYVGTPYIIVRGASNKGAGCGTPDHPSTEQCDNGDLYNGLPYNGNGLPSDTCSWSCHNNWCGDGVVDTEFGEECDEGSNNGRSQDSSGSIGTCTSFCKIPHIPPSGPVVACRDVTVYATNQCGQTADINDGSYSPSGGTVTCTQSPAGPYNIGDTPVMLSCTDQQGHQGQPKTCTVTVVDKVPPLVTLNGPATQSLECKGPAYTEQGATAKDLCPDSPLPVAETGTVNVGTVGTYTLNYTATDPQNNSTTVKRTVTVADTLAPVIAASSSVTTECGFSYTDKGVTANDQCEGNVTGKIVIKPGDSVNTAVVGDYTLHYNVSDTANNAAQAVRTVSVVDTLKPTVTLNAPTTQTVECGGTFTDPGATATDLCAGNLATSVSSSTLNLGVPGSYAISYQATDSQGNVGISSTSRTVTVSDTLAPTLALNGSATMGLECATDFSDPGAKASDQCYGDLTSSIIKTGTVDNKWLNVPQTADVQRAGSEG